MGILYVRYDQAPNTRKQNYPDPNSQEKCPVPPSLVPRWRRQPDPQSTHAPSLPPPPITILSGGRRCSKWGYMDIQFLYDMAQDQLKTHHYSMDTITIFRIALSLVPTDPDILVEIGLENFHLMSEPPTWSLGTLYTVMDLLSWRIYEDIEEYIWLELQKAQTRLRGRRSPFFIPQHPYTITNTEPSLHNPAPTSSQTPIRKFPHTQSVTALPTRARCPAWVFQACRLPQSS